MKKKLMFFALAAIGLASCNGGFQKGEGGLLYKIITDKSGPKIKTGDFVSIDIVIKNDADSVMLNSYDMGHPIPQLLPAPGFKGDIYAGLQFLSEGDSAVVKVNIDSVSKGHPRDKNLKGKFVSYTIKVEKVIAKGAQSDQAFAANYQGYLKSLSDAAQKSEPAKIQKYIADNKLNVTKSDSGLYYVIDQQGSGEKPKVGDTCVVNYTGSFLNGKVFDTSIKSEAQKNKLQINPMNPYKPIRFAIGARGMIKGFDVGFQLISKGTKATFILPSSLAYGQQGAGPIQPFTPLVFKIELVDIIHPNPNAPKPVVPQMPQVQAQQPVKK